MLTYLFWQLLAKQPEWRGWSELYCNLQAMFLAGYLTQISRAWVHPFSYYENLYLSDVTNQKGISSRHPENRTTKMKLLWREQSYYRCFGCKGCCRFLIIEELFLAVLRRRLVHLDMPIYSWNFIWWQI